MVSKSSPAPQPVTNSIFANNSSDGIDVTGGTLTHTYNLVHNNAGGNFEGTSQSTGEITTAPGFMSGGGYRLGYGSPAIDAGTNSAGTVDYDFDSNQRPVGSGYDMGCFEASNFYFVRTDGSDSNSGTGPDSTDAWATIGHAATSALQPGDIVYVQAGTYNEYVNTTVDGTSIAPIQFIGDYQGTVTGWSAGDVRIVAPSGQRSLYVDDDYLLFSGFQIVGNSVQPVYLYNATDIVLDKLDITCSGQHGTYLYNSTATLTNVLMHDCFGYGFYNYGSSIIEMWNCTIANNGYSGIYNTGSATLTITNSIVANNGTFGLQQASGTINHSYNLVSGNSSGNYSGTTAGTGEIDSDPRFTGNNSYYLDLESPAINAGLDAQNIADDDLDGRSRPLGSAWDLGCFEASGAYWKLDETSGTTAAEQVSSLDGTYTGGALLNQPGPYPGRGAIAVELDGTDDHIDLPSADFDFSNGFTISTWVRPTAAPGSGAFYGFVGLSNGAGVDEVWFGWVDAVGLQLYLTDTVDSSSLRTIEDNTDFEIDKWVHVVATVDATGEATLYRNGQVTKTGFNVSLPTNQIRSQNFLGKSVSNDHFPGSIDDVRLYPRQLTAEEVAYLYGLVGHWKMDEGLGTTAADSSGMANDATISGASWVTDCSGTTALAFDGTDDVAATGSAFDPPAMGTVAFWMQASGTPTVRERIFGNGGDWEARQETTGLISFDLGASPFVGNEPFSTADAVDFDDSWYHVVAQYDDSDDSYAVYVNGELTASGISPVDLVEQASAILSFGTRTGSTEYWEGALRDFRVYNRWLSNSEIGELSGLVGYWKFDEISGTVAADSSPNGNHGTYTGGVTLAEPGNNNFAAGFDGSDDYVGVPDDSTLQMDDVFSLSVWVRTEASTNVDRMILNKEGEYEIAVDPGNELKWAVKNTDPGWTWVNTGYIVPLGKWIHIAMTYNSGTVNVYAEGVLVDSYAGSGSIGDQYSSLNELRIGGRSNNPSGKYFDGRVDDVRVYKRVLCPTEVFAQHRGGRPAGIRIIRWVETR